MDHLYPAGPAAVPPELTAPSASYRRNAWLAMVGLLAFVLGYLALLGWFGLTAYRLLGGLATDSDDWLARLLVGGCAAFLTVFMAKALVFIKRGQAPEDHELTMDQQPELFGFLHRLADEAGAPRPHKVYLSPRVNAAVFYDLSLANLVLPSRKNLEIGLGLVNILNLGEFKAVLAHEFGHFAQRSMAVGRWVYIAQQIASHIIAKRDALDTLLRGISSIDFRIAWIGWLLQLIVWSIRSLVELMFRVVILAQRALSRDMEYQADLVAASLTGSDALVSALHRLHAADDAWGRAVDFAAAEADAGRPVLDVFAVQARIVERMRGVLADPHYGQTPTVPEQAPEQHRVFQVELAQPPQMWSTHPANADREANVKRTYIRAGIDDRPAMVLFRDADQLRREVSRRLFRGELPEPVAIEQSLQRLDTNYDRPSLQRRYRGTYLGRSPFAGCRQVSELYQPPGVVTDLAQELAALYPESHGEALDRLRELEQERATLEALRAGHLSAAGGIVRWRGSDVRKRGIPKVIAQIDSELAPLRESVALHDRRCRSLHEAAANAVGGDWGRYLRGLAALAHYAEHAEADVRDAHGVLINTYNIVTADRKVSRKELTRLVRTCNDLQETLSTVYVQADQIETDPRLLLRLGKPWLELLGKPGLPPASDQNINDWMGAVDGWVGHATGALSVLRSSALDTLLEVEDEVARGLHDRTQLADAAPSPSRAPVNYPVLVPGTERKRQLKLDWFDRFQTADGILPTLARVATAGGIIAAVLWVGGLVGQGTLRVYNGLSVPVQVQAGESSVAVAAFANATLSLPAEGELQVQARREDGTLIEAFPATIRNGATAVYNVAGAAALVHWTATYGNVGEVAPRQLGAPRWSSQHADFLFTDPPESISSKGEGGHRTVLSAFAQEHPNVVLDSVPEGPERLQMVAAHARWDSPASPFVLDWLAAASEQPAFAALLQARLADFPDDVAARRMEQDSLEGAERENVCRAHDAAAAKAPDSGDWHYLALRCQPESVERDEAFLAGAARWPDNGWLALASGYALSERGQWSEAASRFDIALARVPSLHEVAIVDVVRTKRMAGSVESAELERLTNRSPFLHNLLVVESGTALEGTPHAAYSAIARGELETALLLANADAETASRIRWFAAASIGATPQMVRDALAQPAGAGIDVLTVWPALALSVREGADSQTLRDAAIALPGVDSAAILRFFDAVRAGRDQDGAEAELGSVDPFARGLAYSMAVVLKGQRSPRAWREGADRLLFGLERPRLE